MGMQRSARVALALALSLWTIVAAALPITGSFSGIASGRRGCWYVPCEPIQHEPLTGTFSFDIDPNIPLTRYGDDYAYGFGWPFTISFSLLGDTAILESPDDDLTTFIGMPSDGSHLSLSFYGIRVDLSELRFEALPGRQLFRNFDLSTFDSSAVDIAASSARLSRDARFEDISIDLRRLTFDKGPDVTVSEPAPWSLFAFCIGVLAMIRRVRHRGLAGGRTFNAVRRDPSWK